MTVEMSVFRRSFYEVMVPFYNPMEFIPVKVLVHGFGFSRVMSILTSLAGLR